MQKLSCTQARQIDLVDYLAVLGFRAVKVRGSDYWYYSPFRTERTPSFKVNRKPNIWYDHGSGEGGNIIDFGILYHHVTVGELLQILAETFSHTSFSFHPPFPAVEEKNENSNAKIIIRDARLLSSQFLVKYLERRCIPKHIAELYCREVDFLLYKKQYTAIGFPNDKGGYELRNACFKGGSSPKYFRFINNGSNEVLVFEGFINFLSWLTINREEKKAAFNFLVLNSLSFFQKAKEIMESHRLIYLLLDRDNAGRQCTEAAIKNNSGYRDASIFYKDCEDLNEWLMVNHSQDVAEVNEFKKLFHNN